YLPTRTRRPAAEGRPGRQSVSVAPSSSGTASWSAAGQAGDAARVAWPKLPPPGSFPPVRQRLQPADPLPPPPPRLEGDDPLGGNLHPFPGAGVACLAGLALLDLEDAEVAQLDTPFPHQRLGDAVKDPLDDLLDLELGEARLLGYRLGHLFLGHEPPLLA